MSDDPHPPTCPCAHKLPLAQLGATRKLKSRRPACTSCGEPPTPRRCDSGSFQRLTAPGLWRRGLRCLPLGGRDDQQLLRALEEGVPDLHFGNIDLCPRRRPTYPPHSLRRAWA